MKAIIRHLFSLIFFWLLFFLLARVIFYLGNTALLADISFSLIARSFAHALRLDLSMIGYLLALPVIILSLLLLFPDKRLLTIYDLLNYFFIILYSVTAIGEMCLYREWKAKLSMQALKHFMNPSEVFASASLGLTILFFCSLVVLSILGIYFYKKIALDQFAIKSQSSNFKKAAVLLITGLPLSAIAIRGGFQQIPVQSSDAFFCTEPTVNDAAVNPLWNIAYNIIDYENHFKNNPYKVFPQEEADRITRALFAGESDSTLIFLKTPKPNIVFIILESWSAHCVKSFGGENFAPFSDSLSRKGIRFSKFYPAGYVSDQGIPGILSAYPSTSRISVINQSSKSAKLNCINRDLENDGYESGFIFGGDLNYGNIKSYIFNQQFRVVKEERDFPGKLRRGNLGIQDKDMALEYISALNKAKEPFVYAWFTVSSHMPYDFPGVKKNLVPVENDYANSIVYSDDALREFFNSAKKQSWYNNTLFVVVADHSHGTHKQFSVYDPEYHRIPFYFFGPVIDPSFCGMEIKDVFSHTDIVPTLLAQLGKEEKRKAYIWGKNMFAKSVRPFAYYCNFSGAGMVENEGYIAYQHGLDQLLLSSFGENNLKADSLRRLAKAFEQSLYEDYRLK